MSEKDEGVTTTHDEQSTWGKRVIGRLVKAAVRARILVEDKPQPPLSETLEGQIQESYDKSKANKDRLQRMEQRRQGK